MPCKPDAATWKALLGACRTHGSVLDVDPKNAAGYVLLSNLYAAVGKWDLKDNIQQLRRERGVKKQPGHTLTEVNNEVHTNL
jgi:hypothetical protein